MHTYSGTVFMCKGIGQISKSFYKIDLTIGILGQVWYLVVSIPDLCTITYF